MSAAAAAPRWAGILPSLPTPFAADGAVDAGAFGEVVRFAVDAGAHGLVCFGLAGEVARLTVEERERLLEVAVAEAAGRVPVLSGATAENLRDAQRLARHAERTGAAGVVIPPPTASPLAQGDIIDFVVAVASATTLPAIVQDAPEYLGVGLQPDAVLAAARRAPNIGAVKLETSAEGIDHWRSALGDAFGIYAGNGGLFLLDCLRAGADGVMPGADTVDRQVDVYEAERAGRMDEAQARFAELLPLIVYEMQSMDHYNRCAKHVLARRGLAIRPELRPPGPAPLSARSIARLDGYVEQLGLAATAVPAG